MAENKSPKGGAGGQSPFEEISDPDTVRDVFNVALKQQKPLKVWLKDKTLEFEVKLAVVNKERIFFDLPHSVSNLEWDSHYNAQMQTGEHHLLGTVQIIKATFFLKILIDGRTDRTINLFKPSIVFKLQRRANMRVRLSFVNQQHLTLIDPLNSKDTNSFRMLDLSVGGTGLAAKPGDAERFKAGTKITGLHFTVMGKPIKCNGIVKHTIEAKDESGAPILKVGVEFVGLQTDAHQLINEFVAIEMQNIFSTLA